MMQEEKGKYEEDFFSKKQLYHLFEWKDFSIFVEN